MNTQELKCFLYVAERLNFTRAAEELYLTTPTVTHHIQKLEGELNVQLFYRDSKTVRLTTAGEIFYSDAREIMMKLEDAVAHLADLQQETQTTIRIGCTTTSEVSYLSDVLGIFREVQPNADPRILIDDFSSLQRLLNEKHLDIVLGSKDMFRSLENCRFTTLFTCTSYAVFCDGCFDFARKDEVSLQELEPYPVIALRRKSVPFRPDDPIERFFAERQGAKQITRQDDPAAVITLAKSGYGIGILPQYALFDGDAQKLHYCKIKGSPAIEYGLVQRKDNQNKCSKALVSIIKKQECNRRSSQKCE